MANILKRNKALSVNPLKASQPIGGSLATLGFNRALPMLHGSQGCTAFAKRLWINPVRYWVQMKMWLKALERLLKNPAPI
jgi:nitrogenase molybdenum-iron protein NifN